MSAEIRQPLLLKDLSESRIGKVWTAENHAEIMRLVGAESSGGQDERLARLKEQAIELSAQLEALEWRKTT